jgi:hypothetical protein
MPSRLSDLARAFADDLSDLLNRTVTHGVRVSSSRADQHFVVGVGVTPKNPRPQPTPLTTGRRTATGYLYLAYRLEMDDEDQFLAVAKSTVGLYADADRRGTLFHDDYERAPGNDYPNPHVQVVGESRALAAIRERAPEATAKVGEIHLPVGGRRFRPTLEDVIELLIVEQLAVAHGDWKRAIHQHRERWRERQLKAAVRRDP